MKHFLPISSEAWCYCFFFIYCVLYSGCWSIGGFQVSILLPTPNHSLLYDGVSAFIIHPARSIKGTIVKILLPVIVSIGTKRQKTWLWMLGSIFLNTGLPSPQEVFSSGQKIPELISFCFLFLKFTSIYLWVTTTLHENLLSWFSACPGDFEVLFLGFCTGLKGQAT